MCIHANAFFRSLIKTLRRNTHWLLTYLFQTWLAVVVRWEFLIAIVEKWSIPPYVQVVISVISHSRSDTSTGASTLQNPEERRLMCIPNPKQIKLWYLVQMGLCRYTSSMSTECRKAPRWREDAIEWNDSILNFCLHASNLGPGVQDWTTPVCLRPIK